MKALTSALIAILVSLSGAGLAAASIQWFHRSASEPAWIASTVSLSAEKISPEIVSRGQSLYARSCSECHADDATGEEGPDLHRLPVGNSYIAVTIKKGIKGEMPSFSKKLNDRQVRDLIAYLRSLP